MRVAIVGAGVMGCATALALAKRGADVVLLERAVPGAEASSAAAGLLGAQIEMHEKRVLFDDFVRARDGYGAWARELRDETGIDVGHRVNGALHVAHNEEEHDDVASAVAWQRSAELRAELVDARGAKQIEPALGDGVVPAANHAATAASHPPRHLAQHT